LNVNYSQTEDENNYLKPGDIIFDFTWEKERENVSSEVLKGKFALIILLSIQCRYCI